MSQRQTAAAGGVLAAGSAEGGRMDEMSPAVGWGTAKLGHGKGSSVAAVLGIGLAAAALAASSWAAAARLMGRVRTSLKGPRSQHACRHASL